MDRRFILGSMVIAAAVMCSTTAFAQVGGGIKVGVNLTSVAGFNDPGNSTSQRTGVVAGGFLTLGLAPMLAFEPEVLFSMQGDKFNFSSSGISTDVTRKLDYIQVPLLLRIGNSGKSAASLYGVVGPTFGILASATQNGQDFKSELKSTDVGVAVGVGVTLSRFLVEGRYTYGLTDLNKVQDPTATPKNRVFSGFIGLIF